MKSGGGGGCRCVGVTYCVSRGSICDDSVRFSPLLFSFRVGKIAKKGSCAGRDLHSAKNHPHLRDAGFGPRARRGRNVGFRIPGLGGGPRRWLSRFMPGARRNFCSSGQRVPKLFAGGRVRLIRTKLSYFCHKNEEIPALSAHMFVVKLS